jgi:hypothetical protein
MKSDKKLLGLFMLGAFKHGSCQVPENKKDALISRLELFANNEAELPEEDTKGVRAKINKTETKDYRYYFYHEHYKTFTRSTEKEREKFYKLIKDNKTRADSIIECCVHFYKVIEVHEGYVIADNIFLEESKELILTNICGQIKKGDTVSAHYPQLMEVVDDIDKIDFYKDELYKLLKGLSNNLRK